MSGRPGAVTRRSVLGGMVGLAGAVVGASLLGGCGEATSSTGAPSGAGQRGGRLRVGALGSPTDTLNPLSATGGADYVAFFNLYDSLVLLKGDRVELSLAESLEPNADATTWTVHLRPDVRFHDGRPMDAADVVYSLTSYADAKRSPNLAQFFADLDVANIRVVDPHTVSLPLRRPRADLVDGVLALTSLVFPAGTTDADWAKGIGSGPFRLTAYEAGKSIQLERNDEYWGGAPMLDEAEVIAIADPNARLNAVRSGEVEYALGVPAAGAAAERNGGAVTVLRGGAANSSALEFAMNVTRPPFDNPDVRLALKLLVDRQALVDTVLFGQGTVGNDVIGLGLPGYATSLPQRERDVDRARTLLAGAGVTSVTLRASDITAGLVDAARLFAEQAREVGLVVRVEQAPADSYFSDFAAFLATPLQCVYYINRPPATVISNFTGSASGFNVTGFATPDYDARLADAQATVDTAARREKFDGLQRTLYDQGGDVVWGFAEQLDATTPGVRGVELSQSVPLLGKASLS